MSLTDKRAFCLLSDLKADLGITDSASDAALERRILVASALIEDYCGRPFRRDAARVESLPGYGTVRLLPHLLPIVSVASVEFDDGTLVDPSLYFIEKDSRGEGWALYTEAGWSWTGPGVQTIAERPQRLTGQERPSFTVTFMGGYVLPNDTVQTPAPLLPEVISEATTMLAATLWRRRGREGNIVGESVGDASVQFGVGGGVDMAPGLRFGIPAEVAAMVDGYKRAV